MLLRFDL